MTDAGRLSTMSDAGQSGEQFVPAPRNAFFNPDRVPQGAAKKTWAGRLQTGKMSAQGVAGRPPTGAKSKSTLQVPDVFGTSKSRSPRLLLQEVDSVNDKKQFGGETTSDNKVALQQLAGLDAAATSAGTPRPCKENVTTSTATTPAARAKNTTIVAGGAPTTGAAQVVQATSGASTTSIASVLSLSGAPSSGIPEVTDLDLATSQEIILPTLLTTTADSQTRRTETGESSRSEVDFDAEDTPPVLRSGRRGRSSTSSMKRRLLQRQAAPPVHIHPNGDGYGGTRTNTPSNSECPSPWQIPSWQSDDERDDRYSCRSGDSGSHHGSQAFGLRNPRSRRISLDSELNSTRAGPGAVDAESTGGAAGATPQVLLSSVHHTDCEGTPSTSGIKKTAAKKPALWNADGVTPVIRGKEEFDQRVRDNVRTNEEHQHLRDMTIFSGKEMTDIMEYFLTSVGDKKKVKAAAALGEGQNTPAEHAAEGLAAAHQRQSAAASSHLSAPVRPRARLSNCTANMRGRSDSTDSKATTRSAPNVSSSKKVVSCALVAAGEFSSASSPDGHIRAGEGSSETGTATSSSSANSNMPSRGSANMQRSVSRPNWASGKSQAIRASLKLTASAKAASATVGPTANDAEVEHAVLTATAVQKEEAPTRVEASSKVEASSNEKVEASTTTEMEPSSMRIEVPRPEAEPSTQVEPSAKKMEACAKVESLTAQEAPTSKEPVSASSIAKSCGKTGSTETPTPPETVIKPATRKAGTAHERQHSEQCAGNVGAAPVAKEIVVERKDGRKETAVSSKQARAATPKSAGQEDGTAMSTRIESTDPRRGTRVVRLSAGKRTSIDTK
ncbi:unnamed protein product, partial [Amoebophrya sp. A25]|eukprot:GSA25T00013246001.1